MSIRIRNLGQLQVHLEGVMSRADHHAINVYKILLPLVGLIVWKADSIDARTASGKHANMVWFNTKNGKRYAIIFNHESAKIDIRDRSQQGRDLISIDNSTSIDSLIAFFQNL